MLNMLLLCNRCLPLPSVFAVFRGLIAPCFFSAAVGCAFVFADAATASTTVLPSLSPIALCLRFSTDP